MLSKKLQQLVIQVEQVAMTDTQKAAAMNMRSRLEMEAKTHSCSRCEKAAFAVGWVNEGHNPDLHHWKPMLVHCGAFHALPTNPDGIGFAIPYPIFLCSSESRLDRDDGGAGQSTMLGSSGGGRATVIVDRERWKKTLGQQPQGRLK